MHRLESFRGPLADSYAGAVALVVCALVPFLMLTAAILPLEPEVAQGVGLARGTLEITIALSDAGYAFGTVLAVQFAQHRPPRRMLLLYVTAFVIAALLGATTTSGPVFIAAFVVEGLCTSLMLIAAVPPLVIGWPTERMPWTGGIMNVCIFGAVAAGPTLGGYAASGGDWRGLFWAVAGIACLALVFAVLTYEDQAPLDRSAPWDAIAVVAAGVGCAAAFFGAGELEVRGIVSPLTIAPLAGGLAVVALLVAYQYRLEEPLVPVKQLATTLPVLGVLVAICASGAAFGLTALVLEDLRKTSSLTHTALLFVPEFVTAIAAAGTFGLLFRSRRMTFLPPVGLVLLAAAAALLIGVGGVGSAPIAVANGLIGFGLGAAVSPALFIAGFSLRSAQIQRVFALIELLRGVSAFLFAPILAFVAATAGVSRTAGVTDAVWVCLVAAVLGLVAASALWVLGGARLQDPDLRRWNEEGEPAWNSPPLLARPRGRGASAGRGT